MGEHSLLSGTLRAYRRLRPLGSDGRAELHSLPYVTEYLLGLVSVALRMNTKAKTIVHMTTQPSAQRRVDASPGADYTRLDSVGRQQVLCIPRCRGRNIEIGGVAEGRASFLFACSTSADCHFRFNLTAHRGPRPCVVGPRFCASR